MTRRLNIATMKQESTMMRITSSLERQQWLEAAVEALRRRFAAAGYTIPDMVRTTIGWLKRAASCGRIGECWPPELSSDRHAETFHLA
jgi:hypothetical protein